MALLNVVIWYSVIWQGRAIEAGGSPATLMIDAGAGLLCLFLLSLVRKPKQLPTSTEGEAR